MKQNKHDEKALNLLKAFRLDLNRIIEGMQIGDRYYPQVITGEIKFDILSQARDELVMARYSEDYQPEKSELDDNNPPQEDSEGCIKGEIKVTISHYDLMRENYTSVPGALKNLIVSKILKDASIPVNFIGGFLEVNSGKLKKIRNFDTDTTTYIWTP